MADTKNYSFEELSNLRTSEIEDLAEYVEPHDGRYTVKVAVDMEEDEEPGKSYFNFKYTIVSTVSLDNPAKEPVAEGSMFSERFYANEFGIGALKKHAILFADLAEDPDSLISQVAAADGAEVEMTVKVKVKKERVKDADTGKVSVIERRNIKTSDWALV